MSRFSRISKLGRSIRRMRCTIAAFLLGIGMLIPASAQGQAIALEDAVNVLVVSIQKAVPDLSEAGRAAIDVAHVASQLPGLSIPPGFELGRRVAAALEIPYGTYENLVTCWSPRGRDCLLVGADVMVSAVISEWEGSIMVRVVSHRNLPGGAHVNSVAHVMRVMRLADGSWNAVVVQVHI
jgi:hypothetical protein